MIYKHEFTLSFKSVAVRFNDFMLMKKSLKLTFARHLKNQMQFSFLLRYSSLNYSIIIFFAYVNKYHDLAT